MSFSGYRELISVGIMDRLSEIVRYRRIEADVSDFRPGPRFFPAADLFGQTKSEREHHGGDADEREIFPGLVTFETSWASGPRRRFRTHQPTAVFREYRQC